MSPTDKRKLLEAAQANVMRVLGTNNLELPESLKPVLLTEPQSMLEMPKTRVSHDSEKTPPKVGICFFLFERLKHVTWIFWRDTILCFFQQHYKGLSLKYLFIYLWTQWSNLETVKSWLIDLHTHFSWVKVSPSRGIFVADCVSHITSFFFSPFKFKVSCVEFPVCPVIFWTPGGMHILSIYSCLHR